MAPLLTAAAVISCLVWSTVRSQTDICYEKADILFIMDSSGSVGLTDFQSQLQFTATFINNFQVGVTQFSVLRFDSTAEIIFDFDDYKDSSALKNAILNIDYPGGGTNTAAALQLARLEAFTSGHGARAGVPRIVIVSTDGLSADPNATALEAQKLKDSNILILSIGIGAQVNKAELDAIGTFQADVFQLANYDQLLSIVYDYSEMICTTVKNFRCSNQADVFFLLDSSSKITNDLYMTELLFASNITSKVDLTDTRIGAATFGGSAVQKLFNLGQYTSQYQLTQALLSALYLGGITDTDTALKSIISQNVFDPASGGRSDAAKILIILTDGGSTSAAQAKVTATQLRATGVNIIAVGVSNPNLSELKDLVSHSVLDVVTNLANPRVAVDRIETLTALQECKLPTNATRDVSDSCRKNVLENGIHPHPYDCTKYIECTFLTTAIMPCPPNQIYDPEHPGCNYPGFVHVQCGIFNSPNITAPPTVATRPPTTSTPCLTGLADILLILDSSDNMGSPGFRLLLGYATNVAEYVKLGVDGVQFAAMSFGTSSEELFDFSDFDEYKPLQTAILATSYRGGSTNIYLSLEDALNVFNSGKGSRPGVPKVALVFSNGESANQTRTQQAATALKNAGVHILSMGLSNTNLQELQAIASTPSEAFVDNFNGLINTLLKYINTTCSETVVCHGIQFADVIFVIDSSASISDTNYTSQLNFLVDVTRRFVLSPDDVRFGAVIFSQDPVKLFDLKDFSSLETLRIAILSAPHLKSGTDTAKALDFVREQQMFSVDAGGRNNATKVLIILTDGRSNSINETVTSALRLKATGVKFIAIGVGDEIYEVELRQLASDADSLFLVSGYKALAEIQTSVSMQVCSIIKVPENPPDYIDLCSSYSWADGKHPNPKDCSTYVECHTFVTTVRTCPTGEAYDPVVEQCRDMSVAHECDDPNYFGPTVSKPSVIEVSTSGPIIVDVTNLCGDYKLPDGIYPDPASCSQFVECTAFGTRVEPCPEGLHFNTINSVCDDVHVVDCQTNYHYFDHISHDQPMDKK